MPCAFLVCCQFSSGVRNVSRGFEVDVTPVSNVGTLRGGGYPPCRRPNEPFSFAVIIYAVNQYRILSDRYGSDTWGWAVRLFS